METESKKAISSNLLLGVVVSNGYEKDHYGYKKTTKENIHWITMFDNGQIQMYAYWIEDTECEKIYDTGLVNVTEDELQTLIKVWMGNYA